MDDGRWRERVKRKTIEGFVLFVLFVIQKLIADGYGLLTTGN
jgi:hypothetical protein